MGKSVRIQGVKPELCFVIPIRTCSKSSNSDGYSPKDWRPGQCVSFLLYRNSADAAIGKTTAAMFTSVRMNSARHGILIGTITMTLEQFDVPTLSHECLHAILEWASEYRPKKLTALCKEEMMAYGLANLIRDAMQGFEQKGYTVLAD